MCLKRGLGHILVYKSFNENADRFLKVSLQRPQIVISKQVRLSSYADEKYFLRFTIFFLDMNDEYAIGHTRVRIYSSMF